MEIKKIYIAGAITGVEDYKEKFAACEKQLTERGFIVLNPAILPEGLGSTDDYMHICFSMIDIADIVLMLPGWEDSRGACREWGYSVGIEKLVIPNIGILLKGVADEHQA